MPLLGTLLMTIDGLTVGLQAVWYSCGMSFKLYFYMVVGIVAVVAVAMLFRLEQNWRWLGERGQTDKAQIVVNKIAQINKATGCEFDICFAAGHSNFRRYLESNLHNFTCLVVYWSITSFNYFLLNFYLS